MIFTSRIELQVRNRPFPVYQPRPPVSPKADVQVWLRQPHDPDEVQAGYALSFAKFNRATQMPIRVFVASLSVQAVSSPVIADIERFAIPGEKGMSFHQWPKLPQVPGWAQDRDFAFRYSANTLPPIGVSFADAEAVIYAKALFKPRVRRQAS